MLLKVGKNPVVTMVGKEKMSFEMNSIVEVSDKIGAELIESNGRAFREYKPMVMSTPKKVEPKMKDVSPKKKGRPAKAKPVEATLEKDLTNDKIED